MIIKKEYIENKPAVDTELSSFKVNGVGKLIITNTGGSSAGDGGMGSGDDSDTREKGDISTTEENKDKMTGNSGGSNNKGSTGDAYQDKVKEETEKASNRSV